MFFKMKDSAVGLVKSRKMSKKVTLNVPSQDGKNAMKYSLVTENLSHLLGEVLTIIDASTEGEKNKALKDLIRDKFGKTQNWLSELAWKEIEITEEGAGTNVPAQYWEGQLIPMIFVDTKGKTYSFKW